MSILFALALSGAAALASPPPPLRLTEHRPLRYALDLTVDPAQPTLTGTAEITVALDHRTQELWLNAEDLSISKATLSAGELTQEARLLDGDDQTVGFTWDEPARGEVKLRVEYTAPISAIDTSGAFVQREGEDAYVFTQMEPLDARRVFPSFDQPEHKTPFSVVLHVPLAMVAHANGPALSETPGPEGFKTIRFDETPPLPTYLFAFAVGPFEVVPAGTWGKKGTPITILTPRGRAADAAFAAEVSGPMLEDLETWFGIDYPFQKLDLVSLPKPVGWGAMENAGLVTMEQSLVIARPEDDTAERRRDFAEVMAHELAHHWFGNLVTPAWWDDLWLNESFATWMSLKVLETRWPEWRMDVTRVAWQGDAMGADSLASARRVREPIRTVDDIEGAFDGITYSKGNAVLTMVEGWLGPETFQRGVQGFLAAHAYESATSDDFVAALSKAADRDLSGVFGGLLEQSGLPEISYTCADGVTPVLHMQQARWLPAGPERARWDLPVCVRYPVPSGEQRACVLLERRAGSLPLEGAARCSDAIVLNDGQRGYYRTRYPERAVSALLAASSTLSVPERVGVLQDASGAVTRGELAPGVLLGQLPALLALGERQITEATLSVAAALDAHLVPAELRPNYARFLRDTYGALAAELGLIASPEEDEETRMLRPKVIRLVGLAGEDPALAEAARPLAERWLSAREGVDPEMVAVVLQIAGRDGGLAWFERLRDQTLAEPDRVRREALFEAMGGQRDARAVTATLDWLTSGAVDVREATAVVFGFLNHEDTAAAQWSWATENLDRLEALIPSAAHAYLVYLGTGFCSEPRRQEVEAFFAPRVGRYVGGRRALAQALEEISICTESRARQEEGVRRFLLDSGAP